MSPSPTVVAGGVGGIALDRSVLLPRMHDGPPHGAWGGRRGPPRDHDFRDRFAREVGLTREQQTRIDSIMDRQGRELHAVRGRVQPELDSIVARTRQAFDSVLTPVQRKRAEAIRKRHRPPPGPRTGELFGAPEGPPPPR